MTKMPTCSWMPQTYSNASSVTPCPRESTARCSLTRVSPGKREQAVIRPKLERIGRRAPLFGDAGFDRRDRHLREATGDEGSKDYAQRLPVLVEGGTGEQETQAAANDFRPCGDAGIGWIEAETVHALDGARFLAEATSQDEEILRVALGDDTAFKASHGMRGQRRRYEEPPCFKIEGCTHRCSNLLVDVPLYAYSSSPVAYSLKYTEGNKHG